MDIMGTSLFGSDLESEINEFLRLPVASSFFRRRRSLFPRPYDYARATRSSEERGFVRELKLGSAFRPEEVAVRLSADRRKLHVEATREQVIRGGKDVEGCSYSMSRITRTIELPADVDVDALRTVLDGDSSRVMVTAPKMLPVEGDAAKASRQVEIKLDESSPAPDDARDKKD